MKLGRHEHYFVAKPVSKKKEYVFSANIFGVPLTLYAASSVFSPRQVDLGTLVLIKHMQIRSGENILDFGCGYGPIGIMAAKTCKTCNVVMVDINERAVGAAKRNLRVNDIKNAKVKQSFFYSALKDEFFDVILINPPMSAGLETCYKIVEGSKEHLVPGGSLQVVSRQHKGGERIMLRMKEVFGNVEIIGRKSGYWIYKSINQ